MRFDKQFVSVFTGWESGSNIILFSRAFPLIGREPENLKEPGNIMETVHERRISYLQHLTERYMELDKSSVKLSAVHRVGKNAEKNGG